MMTGILHTEYAKIVSLKKFDPVMKISKTIIHATPMDNAVASDCVMRLLSRVVVDHINLLDKEEGVENSGTNNVLVDSHGTQLPLSKFAQDEDDANYWDVRLIDAEDNVTIACGHSVEVVPAKYCFDNDDNN